MPNHLHGIIEILENDTVGNAHVRSLRGDHTKMLLSKIIQGFKAAVTKEINKIQKIQNDFHFQWQKSFYDRIIRDEDELNRVRKYIIDNPANWETDRNNLEEELFNFTNDK
jgi:REP element-mobilizing transposase RayT